MNEPVTHSLTQSLMVIKSIDPIASRNEVPVFKQGWICAFKLKTQIYVLPVFDSRIREGAKSNNFSLSDIGNGEYIYSNFRVPKCAILAKLFKTQSQFFKQFN